MISATTTTDIHEIGKRDLRQAQELAWSAIGESGKRRLMEFRGRQSCIEKAQSKPLPGALADTFSKGGTMIDGSLIREVVPIHIACLQAVNSPILNLVQKAVDAENSKADQEFSESDQWEVCYIFTENPKVLRSVLKQGANAIKKAAEEAIDGNWTGAKMQVAMIAVIEQFHRHVKTTVKFTAEIEAQGDASFFQALRGNR